MQLLKQALLERFQNQKTCQRYFITYCLGCCLGLAGIWFINTSPGFPLGGPSDFTTFYTGAQIIRAGEGSHLYDLDTQARFQNACLSPHGWTFKDGLLIYIYPPFFALLFIPLTLLPLSYAFHVWNMISFVLLFAVIRMLLRAANYHTFSHTAYGLLIVISFFPVFEAFNKGQSSFLYLYILTIAYLQLRRGREIPAGLALGCALIKPQFVVPFLIWGAVRKRWSMLASFFFAAMVLLVTSWAIVGVAGIRQYLALSRTAMSWDGPYNFLPAIMPNLRGTIYRISALFEWLGIQNLSGGAMLLILLIASGAMLICLTYFLRQGNGDRIEFDLNFATVLIASVMITPYIYNHDLTLIVLVGIIILGVFLEHKSEWEGKRLIALTHIAIMASLVFLPKTLSAQIVFLLLCSALVFFVKLRRHSLLCDR